MLAVVLTAMLAVVLCSDLGTANFTNPLCGLDCDTPDPWIQFHNNTYHWFWTSSPLQVSSVASRPVSV